MPHTPEIPHPDKTSPEFPQPPEPPQTPDSSPTPTPQPTVIEMVKSSAPNPDTTPQTPRIPKTQEQLKEALKQRAQSLVASIHKKLDVLKERAEAGEFKDKPGETKGSGKTRLEQAQNEILENVKRLQRMKALLDSGKALPQEELVPQNINDLYTPSLKSVFGSPENGYIGTYVDPRTQDYATLKDDVDQTKFGEYTLNPDTQQTDFEHIPEDKIFIPDLSAFNGKSFSEVMQYIAQTYPNHKLPGLEYWEWLSKNPVKTPNKLKDRQLWFYFPGSLVRDSVGGWSVPCAYWNGAGWRRDASWLSSSWDSRYRFVLLEI